MTSRNCSMVSNLGDSQLILANLGCGSRYHASWWNCDYAPTSNGVYQCDITRGIPLPDKCCGVVYHSHVLEHLNREAGKRFIRECYRVLAPGGIIRIAVPDLEAIARAYLTALELAATGTPLGAQTRNHEWMVIEMLDQCIREVSGGAMLDYLHQPTIENKDFVLGRLGEEARNIIESHNLADCANHPVPKLPERLLNRALAIGAKFLRPKLLASVLRERLVRALLGSEMELLQIARFRSQGQIHRWMYDRVSLAHLLLETGFMDFQIRDATDSYIPEWRSFELDSREDGSANKPDSIFVEAVK